ncbi:MAG: argininosuccinate lyase [Elusimicrobiota bacterium]|jgi:argininosuccinate lyase|nr:argininosuccinate lyase [Elusimicrobiota bacterium]
MKDFEQFIGSFSFDERLASIDIKGSIAHVQTLIKCKIIKRNEGSKIIKGLNLILKDLNKGWKLPKAEDIHYAVEKELIKRVGVLGGKMRVARSRNDQVAADLRLYIIQESKTITILLNAFQKTIIEKSQKNISVIMPGFTHLQPAQPIFASHHLLAYAQMIQRDKERLADCLKRTSISPLGSAALGGTSFKLDRQYSAKLLGFSRPCENSLDGVSDRDFAIEFVFCLSLIALHLTRFCEEIILWLNPQFSYIKIAAQFTSGSSIMPQKRNPDCAEIIRGKSGRIFGDLFALLTIVKSLPLAYNRDLQEDKPPVFDASDNIKMSLEVMNEMLASLEFIKENTLKSCQKGFIEATEIADYLAKKGMPFKDAHKIVKQIVSYCIKNNKILNDLSLEQYRSFCGKIENDIYKCIDTETMLKMKSSYGSTSKKSILNQISLLKNISADKK